MQNSRQNGTNSTGAPPSFFNLAKIIVKRINPFGKKSNPKSLAQKQIVPIAQTEKDTIMRLKSSEIAEEELGGDFKEGSNMTSLERIHSKNDISEINEESDESGEGRSQESIKSSLKDIQSSIKINNNSDENKTPLLRTFNISNSLSNLFSPLTKRFSSKAEIPSRKSGAVDFTKDDFKFLNRIVQLEREHLREEIKSFQINEAPAHVRKLSTKWSKAKHNLKSAVRMKKLNNDIKIFGTSGDFAVISDQYYERSLVKEAALKEKIRRRRLHLFFEGSRVLKVWDFALIYLLMYNMFVTTFRIAFYEYEPGLNSIFMMEILNDFLYVIDILISLNTVKYDLNIGKTVEDRAMLIKNYFKTWFIFDIVALFPFDLLDVFTSRPWDYPERHELNYWTFISQPQFYRTIRLIRLFKLTSKVNDRARFERLMDALKVRRAISKLLSFFFSVIVCIHNIGCIWYFSARVQGFSEDTWVVSFGLIDEDLISIYIKSIYWAFMTLSTVGYGDIHAVNDAEYFISILWMMFGLGFYSYTVGALSNLLGSSDSRSSQLFRNILIADEFCKDSRLGKSLKKKIHNALTYSSYKNIFNERDKLQFLNDIPVELKFRVAENLHKGLITDFPFFQNKEEEFIAYFVPCLSALHLNAGEIVYKKGEHPNYVYFLITGRVNYVCGQQSICFKTLVERSYFGEIEIFHNTSRLFSARAQTDSNLLTIKKKDFLDVLSFFQSHRDSIFLLSKSRLANCLESFNKIKELHHISKNSKFWDMKRTTSLFDLVKERRYEHEFVMKGDENSALESPSLKKRIQSLFGSRMSLSQQNIKLNESFINNTNNPRKTSGDSSTKENPMGSQPSTPLTEQKSPNPKPVTTKSVESSRKKLLNLEPGPNSLSKPSPGSGLIHLQPMNIIAEERSERSSILSVGEEPNGEPKAETIKNDLLLRRGVENIASISTFGRRYSKNNKPNASTNEKRFSEPIVTEPKMPEQEPSEPRPVKGSPNPNKRFIFSVENKSHRDNVQGLFSINEITKRKASLKFEENSNSHSKQKPTFNSPKSQRSDANSEIKSFQAEMRLQFSQLKGLERKLEDINSSYGELTTALYDLERKMQRNSSKTLLPPPNLIKIMEVNDFDDLGQKQTI